MDMPDDLDLITRTVLSEAGNQGPLGMAAVANVIKNRMIKRRMSGSDVVLERDQFEPWTGGEANRNDPMKWSPDDPRYVQARRISQAVLSGGMPDATNGATHFANVATVRNRNGGTVGNHGWINPNNQTAQIGAHTFFAPEGRVNFNSEMASPNWQGESTGFQPFNPGGPGSAGAPGMTGPSTGKDATPGASMPAMSASPAGPGASGAPSTRNQMDPNQMMEALRKTMGTQNSPILGRMLFGDGGLPGMMNKIPTPFGGNGLLGGLFGGSGAGAGAGAPMMLPGGPGAAAMGASSAAPALASAAAPTAAAGASGLGSALASLFALI